MKLEIDDLSVHIGRLIKNRRKQLGITQKALGKCIGVSFQQIQKYEKGINKISPDRLLKISCALGVSSQYLLINGLKKNQEESLYFYEKNALDYSQEGNEFYEEISLIVKRIKQIKSPLARKDIIYFIKNILDQYYDPKNT